MVRIVDSQDRRDKILSAAIEHYIDSCIPVSSEALFRQAGLSLSSATIRNVLADLETDGYLAHPHTSSGRVPTDKGYRYYVDFLMPEEDRELEQKNDILQALRSSSKDLEEFLDTTLSILSEKTHCAGLASFVEWEDKIFYKGASMVLEQPEFRDYSRLLNLIRIFEEKERLFNLLNRDMERYSEVYIGRELMDEMISSCSVVISSYRKKDKPCGRIAILGPTRLNYRSVVPFVKHISDLLSEILSLDE